MNSRRYENKRLFATKPITNLIKAAAGQGQQLSQYFVIPTTVFRFKNHAA